MIRVVWGTARDGAGNVIQSGNVTCYVHGSTTPSTIYLDAAATIPVTSVTSNALDGSFIFYISDNGLVLYDVQITGTGFSPKLYTYIQPTPLTGGLPVSTGTPTSITGILKGNGSTVLAATAKTDYAPATSGSAILKGDGIGGFAAATPSSDYAPATSGSSILIASSGGFRSPSLAAAKTTDYVIQTTDVYGTIMVNPGATMTLTLPAANAVIAGAPFRIRNIYLGTAYTVQFIGVINGITNPYMLGLDWELMSNGTNWYARVTPTGNINISPNTLISAGTAAVLSSLKTQLIAAGLPAGASYVSGYASTSDSAISCILSATNDSKGAMIIDVSAGGSLFAFWEVDLDLAHPQECYYENVGSGTSTIYLTKYKL